MLYALAMRMPLSITEITPHDHNILVLIFSTGRGPIISIAMTSNGAETSTWFIRDFLIPGPGFRLKKYSFDTIVLCHLTFPAIKIASGFSAKFLLDVDDQLAGYCVTESLLLF